MRQLLVEVPRGYGARVLELAERHDAVNLARFEATGRRGDLDVAVIHVPNGEIETLVSELEEVPDLRVAYAPQGIITLKPPPEEAPDEALEIETRSPIEVFYSGLQSIGSWRGFLAYATVAGFVVWTGLFTNTVFLLVAAMLIAPFAGPAMTVAMGTARGDATLLRRGAVRYIAALAVTTAVCYLLSLVLQQRIATEQMIATSTVSAVAIVLPLAAGAAGALNLVQSERNSLVSGAAVGVLVAASLAPPAGMIGMAAAIGEWEMVRSGFFLLGLQLLGINLAGGLVFRLYGLSAEGARYSRGKEWLFWGALALTILGLAAMLTWQFWSVPNLQRSSRSQRAAAVIQQTVQGSGLARLVEVNSRFTRADSDGQSTLLCVVYVQRSSKVEVSEDQLRDELTRRIQQRILAEGFNVTPLVSVTVLEPPDGSP
ncbi:MAG: TIGR00341 family protein [Armatimonadota bacterium]